MKRKVFISTLGVETEFEQKDCDSFKKYFEKEYKTSNSFLLLPDGIEIEKNFPEMTTPFYIFSDGLKETKTVSAPKDLSDKLVSFEKATSTDEIKLQAKKIQKNIQLALEAADQHYLEVTFIEYNQKIKKNGLFALLNHIQKIYR